MDGQYKSAQAKKAANQLRGSSGQFIKKCQGHKAAGRDDAGTSASAVEKVVAGDGEPPANDTPISDTQRPARRKQRRPEKALEATRRQLEE
jgi:hypothetical protein